MPILECDFKITFFDSKLKQMIASLLVKHNIKSKTPLQLLTKQRFFAFLFCYQTLYQFRCTSFLVSRPGFETSTGPFAQGRNTWAIFPQSECNFFPIFMNSCQ